MGSRASLFAGPVLKESDPVYKPDNSGKIRYPLRFWKVVAAVSLSRGEPELVVNGFWCSQKKVVDSHGLEAIDFDPFHKEQCSLKELTELTGVVFDALLYDNDVMAGVDAKEIRKTSDVRVWRNRTPATRKSRKA